MSDVRKMRRRRRRRHDAAFFTHSMTQLVFRFLPGFCQSRRTRNAAGRSTRRTRRRRRRSGRRNRIPAAGRTSEGSSGHAQELLEAVGQDPRAEAHLAEVEADLGGAATGRAFRPRGEVSQFAGIEVRGPALRPRSLGGRR